MANKEHLAVLRQGVDVWNSWRQNNPSIIPDLHEANLQDLQMLNQVDFSRTDLRGAWIQFTYVSGANLIEANLEEAKLWGANFSYSKLNRANLSRACLREAFLRNSDLSGAILVQAELIDAFLTDAVLCGAHLNDANLDSADLARANLEGADFSGAALIHARLVAPRLEGAILTNSHVYGISTWDIVGKPKDQTNLVITRDRQDEPVITVDNLEVAQFIYLLLNNEKIREVIDTITSKAVLILGRFTPERKAVLDAIRDELRHYAYLPIIFDFKNPEGEPPVKGRNYIETVSTLAHMARFIIADLTDAKVVLQELEHIVPGLPSVPVQPIIQAHTDITDVIIDFVGRPNFLELYVYRDIAEVKTNLHSKIIQPAEAQLTEIHTKRLQFLEQVRQITNR